MTKFPRLLSALLSTLLFSAAFSQNYQQRIQAYINDYKELAISEMLRTGIPASVTLAQGILETSGGQSDLASMANNHFGIKCKSTWNGDYMLHDDDAKNECFRKYASVEDSYRDHSDFLRTRPCYAFLFKLDPTDYEGWAKGLRKAGYATSSTYAIQLIKLIVENNLQEYTLLALQRTDMRDDLFVTAHTIENNTADITEGLRREADMKEIPVITYRKESAKPVKSNSKYPLNSIFNINEAKVIYAEAGTSLLAVANNYNVSYKKLIEFNDLDQTDIITANQLIFLQKKSKKGTKEVHIVEVNESLHDISQAEGVQLSSILEYNGLQKGMQPAPGEKIYLKNASPSNPRLAAAGIYKLSASM